jgi:hypothetical protein
MFATATVMNGTMALNSLEPGLSFMPRASRERPKLSAIDVETAPVYAVIVSLTDIGEVLLLLLFTNDIKEREMDGLIACLFALHQLKATLTDWFAHCQNSMVVKAGFGIKRPAVTIRLVGTKADILNGKGIFSLVSGCKVASITTEYDDEIRDGFE